ncbi:MAG: hypothetical protein A2Z20_08090 [Bdellovibrionales bacterium RBG_16_40_8]|nr:MAG: hypothetical protein A2Z20_08090 [Bdellovibrionales bacterium RBG_16_40_8]
MKSYQPLIISLLVHLCLYLMALLMPNESPAPHTQEIEVLYKNTNNSVARQIVMDPSEKQLEKSLQNLKDKAERLSRLTQRVKNEILANKNGPPQNKSQSFREKLSNELKKPITDIAGPSIDRPMPDKVAKDTRLGDSSISDYIPEIRSGGFTALNTDQFIHYTFYARINEQIRNRWIENVRVFILSTSQAEINRLALKTQISEIEVILDPAGRFVRALVHQQAQNTDLDLSATKAFQQAAPLNNPPSEMVESDGHIHLRYAFYVFLRSRYIASGSNQ